MSSIENQSKGSLRIPIGLGSLEAQLMELLWASATPLLGQEILKALDGTHNYKTVMTVLNRLVEKKLLIRTPEGKAYRYQTVENRDAFLRSVASDLVNGYKQAYGTKGLRYILDAAALDGCNSTKETKWDVLASDLTENTTIPSRIATLLAIVIGLELLRIIFGKK